MTAGRGAQFLSRIDAVEQRLRAHASSDAVGGLTEPDPPTGERWEWGQVWAHLAEFVPYWIGEVRTLLAGEGAAPFGRTKADHERVAAIERDRGVRPSALMDRISPQLVDLRELVASMSDEDWARAGRHPTLGEMAMPRIFEEFLVGHLESHADQLDGLARGDGE